LKFCLWLFIRQHVFLLHDSSHLEWREALLWVEVRKKDELGNICWMDKRWTTKAQVVFSSAKTNYLLSDDEGGNSKDGMEQENFQIQAIWKGECNVKLFLVLLHFNLLNLRLVELIPNCWVVVYFTNQVFYKSFYNMQSIRRRSWRRWKLPFLWCSKAKK
jgi:hypothetical protein